MTMTYKSPNFKIVQDWLGLDDFDTDRLMTIIDELAEENKIDLNDATHNQVRNLADAAFRIVNEEGWK